MNENYQEAAKMPKVFRRDFYNTKGLFQKAYGVITDNEREPTFYEKIEAVAESLKDKGIKYFKNNQKIRGFQLNEQISTIDGPMGTGAVNLTRLLK